MEKFALLTTGTMAAGAVIMTISGGALDFFQGVIAALSLAAGAFVLAVVCATLVVAVGFVLGRL